MRLYKITAKPAANNDDGVEPMTRWVGSKAEGVAARKDMALAGFSRKEINEAETEVPTDKLGLLAFLNENVK